ncbi:ubiquitin-like-specific protease 1D isoform X2 [Telopea speciosissima]|uniref:ubiquitin-like-specific protease 1D isoform X2 n=1 Tax=Telopea speciosissima TaxID=54955 RepID=UPI001CC4F5CE|nr:ubiquitin-like-specific protease 1D isoform X2 [Telopea speciosissima]
METVEGKKGKKQLDIDFDALLKNDDAPAELEVVPVEKSSQDDDLVALSDHQLDENIRRLQRHDNDMSSRLPDKGAKLRARLQRLEDEKKRRSLLRLKKDDDDCKKATQSRCLSFSGFAGACNGSSSVRQSSQSHSQSAFAPCFNVLLERKACRVSSRKLPFKSVIDDSLDKDRQRLPNGGDQKVTAPRSLNHQEENLSGRFSKKRTSSELQTLLDSKTRKGQSHQTVVLVDEEDCPSLETTQQKDQPIERMKDKIIYYPSRNDPESVEICYLDIDCLAPEAFLSSTIMNFYIRYLQRPVSPTGRPMGDYHFFNTYFYKKLKEAVSCKKSEKDAFMKFRRWWKGVNIFQKAYIFLPIHENLHWSLVIICNLEKDDESGQIILLHLDSLGYHNSFDIFEDIRSFLKEEWKYLSEEVAAPDPSIGDRVRRNLRSKICEKIITVPQQRNDYDCGIFVLYFMERFIEEAPARLKKKDLDRFGKQWFKHEEASGLRKRIRDLLNEEFENAKMEDFSRESSPVSSGDAAIGHTKDHSDS